MSAVSKVELFILDQSTRMVDLNKEWISTIKEFKKILTRDKGSKGDIDGRKKFQALREFTFMYHYCDYASKYANYSEEDKLKECILNAELPDDFDFTKDPDLVAAVSRYKGLQETPALKLLYEAKEGLHLAHKVIRKIRLHIETQLANIDLGAIVDEGEDGKKKVKSPLISLKENLEALMSLANEVEPAMTTVDNLTEKVKKQLGDKTELRGGREKGTREDNHIIKLPSRDQEETSTGKAGMFADV